MSIYKCPTKISGPFFQNLGRKKHQIQDDLLSVTFDPETAEIRLLIVTQHSAAISFCLFLSLFYYTVCLFTMVATHWSILFFFWQPANLVIYSLFCLLYISLGKYIFSSISLPLFSCWNYRDSTLMGYDHWMPLGTCSLFPTLLMLSVITF